MLLNQLSLVLILLNPSCPSSWVNVGIHDTTRQWLAFNLEGGSEGSVFAHLLFSLYTCSFVWVFTTAMVCYWHAIHLLLSSLKLSYFCMDLCSSWVSDHQLKLNLSKAELLLIPGDASLMSRSCHLPGQVSDLTICHCNQPWGTHEQPSDLLSLVICSCKFLLLNIRRIQPFLSTEATHVLVRSLVILILDYCNSLLAVLPLSTVQPLRRIQNAAATSWLFVNHPKFWGKPWPNS